MIGDFKHRTNRAVCVGLSGTPAAAGTVNQNPYFDASGENYCGKPIRFLVWTGAVTGTPDSFTATFTARQSANADGSSGVAIVDCYENETTKEWDDSVVLSAANQNAMLEITPDLNDGKYVGVRCVTAFVNGSTPKVEVGAIAIGEKRTF